MLFKKIKLVAYWEKPVVKISCLSFFTNHLPFLILHLLPFNRFCISFSFWFSGHIIIWTPWNNVFWCTPYSRALHQIPLPLQVVCKNVAMFYNITVSYYSTIICDLWELFRKKLFWYTVLKRGAPCLRQQLSRHPATLEWIIMCLVRL